MAKYYKYHLSKAMVLGIIPGIPDSHGPKYLTNTFYWNREVQLRINVICSRKMHHLPWESSSKDILVVV